MELLDYIEVDTKKDNIISIVGGGGKTSTMYKLAKELRYKEQKVLVTTTTAIMMPEKENYDYFFIEKEEPFLLEKLEKIEKGTITIVVKEFIREDKVKGLDITSLEKLIEHSNFNTVIVESDGARMKPIKAPREDEPLVLDKTNIYIGLIGLDSIGLEIIEENVHRADIFTNITESNMKDIIDKETIINLVTNPRGLFKKNHNKKSYLILNKADNNDLVKLGYEIKTNLSNKIDLENVLITKLKEEKIWV